MDIGEKIKNLRLKNNLTQEELADRTELSKGFISQVERGQTSPSIATLIDMLECLGTSASNFFREETAPVVFRKEDYFIAEDEHLQSNVSWLVPNSLKNNIEPILVTLQANGVTKANKPHVGEVFGYVLDGEVVLIVGDNAYPLVKEESFYFSANEFYQLKNNKSTKATVLMVSSPPSF